MSRLLISSLLLASMLLSACGTPPMQPAAIGVVEVPTRIVGQYEQALGLARNGDTEAAIQSLEAFVSEHTAYPGAYLTLSQLQLAAEQTDAAVATLQQAILLHPDYAPAHNQLGVIYRDQGEFERANAAYESALRVSPEYALAYFNLGVLNDLYRQQPELALDYYQQYRLLLPEGVEDAEVDRWIADLQRRTEGDGT
jgi:tetratricopeptide (TPR) repeat protein